MVTRSKAKALAAASFEKPRIVIRIKKQPSGGAIIQRREPDDVSGTGLGFFGHWLRVSPFHVGTFSMVIYSFLLIAFWME